MKTISVFGITALMLSLVSHWFPDMDVPPPPEADAEIESLEIDDDIAVAPPPPIEETGTEKLYNEILRNLNNKGGQCLMTTINLNECKLIIIIVPQD